mgnify:CR=1 FL=1
MYAYALLSVVDMRSGNLQDRLDFASLVLTYYDIQRSPTENTSENRK